MIYLGKDPVGMNQLNSIDWDAIASGQKLKSVQNIYLSNSITEIAENSFYGIPIENISGKNVEIIHSNAFYTCNKLESCNFPNVQVIEDNAFRNTQVKYIIAPKLYSIGSDAFYSNAYLKSLDIGNKSIASFIGKTWAFEQNSACITIFRYNFVLQAANNWFYQNCFLKSATVPGTLYVWQDLIEEYQNHKVWGPLLASNNNQILPIEGSIYETQYGDGTPINEEVIDNG